MNILSSRGSNQIRRKEQGEKQASLYEIYERESKSIFQRDETRDEGLFDYNIKKGITPLVSGERKRQSNPKILNNRESTGNYSKKLD